LRGGVGAGVRVSESDRITVRNCLIAENRGDGVLFDASSDGLVFNNVIFDNEGSGVRMRRQRRSADHQQHCVRQR